ncbi:MAG: DUF4147 domain-containing protein, partial [Clostridia bacterium]|nr:DUF4147 domain-containing protein [Clostridia bacterium]
GKRILVAVGKAAWDMADAAVRFLKEPVSDGIVITKHGHARGPIGPLKIREAGHPVPDADTFRATEEVLSMTSGLGPEDRVLFLVSGGGSALFEKPLIPEEEYASLTAALLKSGIPIGPFNAVRKHLSAVKGGRFALHCLPASVDAVILSDVIGDPPDVIASGPVTADKSTSEEAISVLRSLAIPISERTEAVLRLETPKSVPNVSFRVTGSLKRLCGRAAETAAGLGYVPEILTCELQGDASEAGERFAEYANRVLAERSPLPGNAKRFAFLAGGETTVRVTGNGTGGRCQEMAVSCAKCLRGKEGVLFFAFGSDGTDGPTDAAGGFADGRTVDRMEKAGFAADTVLRNNDSYHALEAVGNLLVTGPTGTNVNDLAVLLVRTAPS